ncbi:MAG: hypothetical protein WA584_01245 [Pyrinomonadaceae bacterium]
MKFWKIIRFLSFLFILFACFAPLREISSQTPEISGEIEKIKYTQFVNDNLKTSKLENFDINKSSGALTKIWINSARIIYPTRQTKIFSKNFFRKRGRTNLR